MPRVVRREFGTQRKGDEPVAKRPAVLKAFNRVTDTMVGGSDGRYLRLAGIPAYGVQGFFQDGDDVRAHRRDERMPVRSFYEGQTFLYEFVKALTQWSLCTGRSPFVRGPFATDPVAITPVLPRQTQYAGHFCGVKRLHQHVEGPQVQGFLPQSLIRQAGSHDHERGVLKRGDVLPHHSPRSRHEIAIANYNWDDDFPQDGER